MNYNLFEKMVFRFCFKESLLNDFVFKPSSNHRLKYFRKDDWKIFFYFGKGISFKKRGVEYSLNYFKHDLFRANLYKSIYLMNKKLHEIKNKFLKIGVVCE